MKELGVPGAAAPAFAEVITPETLKRYPLQNGVTLAAGRSSSGNQITLPDSPLISKRHFLLCFDGDKARFIVKDVSSNGLFAVGRRLPPRAACALPPGAVLELPGKCCRVRLVQMK